VCVCVCVCVCKERINKIVVNNKIVMDYNFDISTLCTLILKSVVRKYNSEES